MKILIADDNVNMQILLSTVLRSEGHEVLVAERGDEAVEVTLKEKVDLILLDINMPGMTGRRVAESLQQMENDTPIIIITGDDVESIQSDFENLTNVLEIVGKPFTIKEMIAKVERMACQPKLA
jgi:CheY-like chemotaxis protein